MEKVGQARFWAKFSIVSVQFEKCSQMDYPRDNMKKGIFLALVGALGFGIYVYAQDKTKSVMPVAKEVPKAMAKEEAAMKLTDEEWKKASNPGAVPDIASGWHRAFEWPNL